MTMKGTRRRRSRRGRRRWQVKWRSIITSVRFSKFLKKITKPNQIIEIFLKHYPNHLDQKYQIKSVRFDFSIKTEFCSPLYKIETSNEINNKLYIFLYETIIILITYSFFFFCTSLHLGVLCLGSNILSTLVCLEPLIIITIPYLKCLNLRKFLVSSPK